MAVQRTSASSLIADILEHWSGRLSTQAMLIERQNDKGEGAGVAAPPGHHGQKNAAECGDASAGEGGSSGTTQ